MPQLEFDPANYTERALRLIMANAEKWQVTPGEAVARLMDQLARRTLKRLEARMAEGSSKPAA